jgi:hypothetical protein
MAHLDFAEVRTHDSRFTRGYEAGYFQAKIEDRRGFSRRVLAEHWESLGMILAGTRATVEVSAPTVGQYGVPWVEVTVAFPPSLDEVAPRVIR